MSSWISRAKFIMEGKSPKITQKDLITVMGKTTRGAVGHYFTGRSRPTLDQLEDLAKYLGVSLSWLVSDNGDNAAVDDETLQMCLELVNDAQANTSTDLSALAHARMAAYLYRNAKDGKKVNTQSATDLIKLMAT